MKLLQTQVNSLWDVCDVCDDLGCHKEFLPFDTALLDSESQLGLGVVDLCPIQVVVPQLDGRLYRLDEVTIDAGVACFLVPRSTSAVSQLP